MSPWLEESAPGFQNFNREGEDFMKRNLLSTLTLFLSLRHYNEALQKSSTVRLCKLDPGLKARGFKL